MNKAFLIVALVFCVILGTVSATQNTLCGITGVAYNSSGSLLYGGDIKIKVSDNADCSAALYTETFIDALRDGYFAVVLGESSPLALDFNDPHYYCVYINNVLQEPTKQAICGQGQPQWSQLGGIPAGFADGIDDANDAPLYENLSQFLNDAGFAILGDLPIYENVSQFVNDENYLTTASLPVYENVSQFSNDIGYVITIPATKILYVDGGRADFYTEDGTILKPYKTIQSALAVATFGTLVKIAPSTYTETITLPNGVSLEGSGTTGTSINGDVSTPIGGANLFLKGINFNGVLTIGSATSIIECYSYNATRIVGTATVQAYNYHITPSSGVIPLTMESSGKYHAILSTISSQGDVPAINQTNGILILNTAEISGSSFTSPMILSTGGLIFATFSQILNYGGGLSADIDNGATSPPNSLTDTIIIGGIDCGSAHTLMPDLKIISGSISGTDVTYSEWNSNVLYSNNLTTSKDLVANGFVYGDVSRAAGLPSGGSVDWTNVVFINDTFLNDSYLYTFYPDTTFRQTNENFSVGGYFYAGDTKNNEMVAIGYVPDVGRPLISINHAGDSFVLQPNEITFNLSAGASISYGNIIDNYFTFSKPAYFNDNVITGNDTDGAFMGFGGLLGDAPTIVGIRWSYDGNSATVLLKEGLVFNVNDEARMLYDSATGNIDVNATELTVNEVPVCLADGTCPTDKTNVAMTNQSNTFTQFQTQSWDNGYTFIGGWESSNTNRTGIIVNATTAGRAQLVLESDTNRAQLVFMPAVGNRSDIYYFGNDNPNVGGVWGATPAQDGTVANIAWFQSIETEANGNTFKLFNENYTLVQMISEDGALRQNGDLDISGNTILRNLTALENVNINGYLHTFGDINFNSPQLALVGEQISVVNESYVTQLAYGVFSYDPNAPENNTMMGISSVAPHEPTLDLITDSGYFWVKNGLKTLIHKNYDYNTTIVHALDTPDPYLGIFDEDLNSQGVSPQIKLSMYNGNMQVVITANDTAMPCILDQGYANLDGHAAFCDGTNWHLLQYST